MDARDVITKDMTIGELKKVALQAIRPVTSALLRHKKWLLPFKSKKQIRQIKQILDRVGRKGTFNIKGVYPYVYGGGDIPIKGIKSLVGEAVGLAAQKRGMLGGFLVITPKLIPKATLAALRGKKISTKVSRKIPGTILIAAKKKLPRQLIIAHELGHEQWRQLSTKARKRYKKELIRRYGIIPKRGKGYKEADFLSEAFADDFAVTILRGLKGGKGLP